jgi:tRNA pseudouridine55 synthase
MRNVLNGVVIIDKPANLSSARTVAQVKAMFQVAKAGHSGTLDPFATGVLICCLNQATRLARFFLNGRKTYEAVMRLGTETDTQDATGRVISRTEVPKLSEDRIKEAVAQFEGNLMQQPPAYSALKHQGVPLYKLARQGKAVHKPPRPVTIHRIGLLGMDLPDIRFTVTCSAGTYVRTLCADIGQMLGCGGHLVELRRTASSCFSVDQARSPESLKAADHGQRLKAVIPMTDALPDMPAFRAESDLAGRIAQGQPLTTEDIPLPAADKEIVDEYTGLVKIVDGLNQLRAIIEALPNGGYNYCCVFH